MPYVVPADHQTLLALCARAHPHAAHQAALRTAAQAVARWDGLIGQAEAEGMAPLLAAHLQQAGLTLPESVARALQAVVLRQRHAHQGRDQALQEILTTYQAAGIPVVLLKGAALARSVYPQPWLRPMRDLDLLVRTADAHRAQALLATCGFQQPPTPSAGMPDGHHHLASVIRTTEGVTVSIEIHHALDLYAPGRPLSTFDDLAPTLRPLRVHDTTAYMLGDADQLWHVYRHAFGDSLTGQRWRLIWVADMVSLVEAGLERIDWAQVRRQYPALMRVLPMLHTLTPWSPAVIERLQLPVAHVPAANTGQFTGWPYATVAEQWPKGVRQIIGDTFFPSAWWLRMHYGEGPSRLGGWRAWLKHQQYLWPHLRWALKLHATQHARWANRDNLQLTLLLYLIWQQHRAQRQRARDDSCGP